MPGRQAQLLALAEEGDESAINDLFKEFPSLYRKMYGQQEGKAKGGKIKGMRKGGLARRKRK